MVINILNSDVFFQIHLTTLLDPNHIEFSEKKKNTFIWFRLLVISPGLIWKSYLSIQRWSETYKAVV